MFQQYDQTGQAANRGLMGRHFVRIVEQVNGSVQNLEGFARVRTGGVHACTLWVLHRACTRAKPSRFCTWVRATRTSCTPLVREEEDLLKALDALVLHKAPELGDRDPLALAVVATTSSVSALALSTASALALAGH